MIFLIEYNRQKGRIVSFKKFENSERVKAQTERLELELESNRKKDDHEIVILEATTESLLRKTHRRYFESLDQLLNSFTTKRYAH